MKSRRLGTLLATVLCVAAFGCRKDHTMANQTKAPQHEADRVDGRFEVAGGMMYLQCTGAGNPVVVFDSALGQGADAWNEIAPAIATSARVCAYDRKGVGRSDAPAHAPHTPRQMADELHALLAQADVPGPYVLVGHSIGGITMQLFAGTWPADVAGLVLVEAADDPAPLWALMPAPALAQRQHELATSPEGLDWDSFVAGAREMHAHSRPLGDRPLVILTRGKPDAPPGATDDVAERWLELWRGQQDALRPLSTNMVQVVAPNSGHMMPREAPALVTAAVQEVVRAVRDHGRVTDQTLRLLARG
jgi:pimeloyl-ACP methyl ester carboxylesterase